MNPMKEVNRLENCFCGEIGMDTFNISRVVDIYLKKWKGKKIAIYPFGKYGVRTKEILNYQYGLYESVIVDNGQAHFNTLITSLDDVNDCREYIWFLTCGNPGFHKEILESIRDRVPEEQIMDLFGNSPIYSDEYRLLSKIGTRTARSTSYPCEEFIELVKKKKGENRNITVGEVGIGCGATAVEVCRYLTKDDVYMCFDFENLVADLLYDLNKVPGLCCRLVGKGNSHKLYDSYNWNLSDLLFKMRNDSLNGIFDVVYLDGAHSFSYDAAACCLLKELLKPDGYMVFDDIFWSYSQNENLAVSLADFYTEQQMEECQVQRVINAFMIGDRRFEEVYMSGSINPGRAVYVKRHGTR